MSTILSALRKSKSDTEPAGSDASDSVLRHGIKGIIDGKEQAPEDPPTHLRGIVFGSLCVLAILAATLIALHLRNEAHRVQAAATPTAEAGSVRPADVAPAPVPTAPVQEPVTPPPHSLFASGDADSPQAEPAPPSLPVHVSEEPEPTPLPTPEHLPAFTRPIEPPARVYEDPGYDEEPPYVEPDEPAPAAPAARDADSIADRLTVNGIFVDKDTDPLAMINGQSVRVGSTVAGAKVIEIRRDAVVVRFEGSDYELRY